MLQIQNNTLHLIDTLWLGGAQQVVKKIFGQNSFERKLHLLVLRHTDPMISVDHPNVAVVPTNRKWDFTTAYRHLYHYIQEHNIRTLHCHLPKSQTLGLLLKIRRFPYLKLLFQEQGDITDQMPMNLPAYFAGGRYIDKVLCCSGAVKKKLLSRTFLHIDQADIVYNFPSLSAANTPHKMPHLTKRIGFAGRITKRKGWRAFVEAVAKLRALMPDMPFEIHIAGTGPEENLLKSMVVECQLESYCTFHGFVQNMQTFYESLDLLCIPSHYEPMGMVHLEAMLCKVPVIASNVSGMNEVLKHEENCLLFPPRDVDELTQAMWRVLRDNALVELLVKNGLRTAKEYSYESFERRLGEIYQQLDV